MKKVLMIVGGVVIGLVILFVLILSIISGTSNKLVCESDIGSITIMYNNKTITGYTTNGFSYAYGEQREYAEQIGIEEYLDEFSEWFSTNTSGSCTR